MHPQEIEKLKQLIKASTILTDLERTEWLELLPVMNDKQLGELQTILVPSAGQIPAMPTGRPLPLTHIANVPTGVSFGLPSPPPAAPTRPPNQQFAQQLQQTIKEKELPAPRILNPSPVASPSPRPHLPPTPRSIPPQGPPGQAPKISNISEVNQLTPRTFRLSLPELWHAGFDGHFYEIRKL